MKTCTPRGSSFLSWAVRIVAATTPTISTRGTRWCIWALAGFEKDPIRADFLRRYSLDRLPNDRKLCQRAAEFLRKQGREDLAREVEVPGQ